MRLEIDTATTLLPLVKNAGPSETFDFETNLKDGIAAAQAGKRETARSLLSMAADIDPRSEDVWMWLASISEYPEELLAFLNNVLQINPANQKAAEWHIATRSLLAKTLVGRGVEAHENGSDMQASALFAQAIETDQNCELAWFWLAGIAASDEEKRRCLQRVVDINPENDKARGALDELARATVKRLLEEAKISALDGRLNEALSIIDEILTADERNAEAWMLRSHVSVNMKEKLAALERVMELQPENLVARSSYDFLSSTLSVVTAPLAEQTVEENEKEQPAENVSELDSITAAEPIEDAAEPTYELTEPMTENVELRTDDPSAQELFVPDVIEAPENTSQPTDAAPTCPYCHSEASAGGFECSTCHAVLTLADIEALLSSREVEHSAISDAVAAMESSHHLEAPDVEQLTTLAVGHFNLGDLDQGFHFLQQASRLDPNNVILAGHVNTVAIRLDEIRRQNEIHDNMPKGKMILVVDDSATVRKLISGKLSKSGHNVVCASDGVEGLERLNEQMPDLVLLDIGMPRLDGYEVCRQIRSNPAAKELPVVMISGKDGFFDKVRGRMAGATGYVTKPFGPETLMKALETYLSPNFSPQQNTSADNDIDIPVTDELSLNV